MKQITILRNSQITNQASFETQELLDNWYNYHSESFGEHEVLIEDLSAQLEQERINSEAKAYLAATDWYIVRFMENGTEVPYEVGEARQNAREAILNDN